MAARAIDLERIDRFLGTERQIEDAMERLRDMVCDLVWAGDGLHSVTDPGEEPEVVERDLPIVRSAWRSVGGDAAIEAFDNIAGEILRRLAEEKR